MPTVAAVVVAAVAAVAAVAVRVARGGQMACQICACLWPLRTIIVVVIVA